MMKRSAVLVMLVAGLAVGGCGGDDAATTTDGAGARLTKAQYIVAADKVCKATSDKIAGAATKLRASAEKSGTLPVAQVTKFLTETSLPAYDGMIADLNKLTPPKQDEQTIDGLIAALAGAVETAKANPAKYSKNDAPDPFDDANSRAIDYGMKVCGSS